jgi:hypothetical protein
MFAFEAFVASRAEWPPILTVVVNPIFSALRLGRVYLPFQAVAVARKLSITMFIAHAQITPLLQSPQKAGTESQQLKYNLDRMDAASRFVEQESERILQLEMVPFADDNSRGEVKNCLTEWLVHNTLGSQPDVRNARGEAIQRRRQNVPPGAKGTK